MRICFDRLCFATKRPAENERTDAQTPPKPAPANDTPYQLTINNKNFKNSSKTNKNGSINALDPPILKQPTTSQSVNLEIIGGGGRTFSDDDNKFGAYENSLQISDSDSILNITKYSTTSSANNKLRKIDLETDSCESNEMDQEQNPNFQYQQDLLLNNISPLISESDLLTHNLIFGTVPPNGEAQGISNDPSIQLSILEQQQIALRQRYQLMQIALQQKALPPSTLPSPSSPSKPITAQMQDLRLSTEQPNFTPSTPHEEYLVQMINSKNLRIQELQRVLQSKENDIAELKSQLDKFQSVFPFRSHSGQNQRQRAQGISAEPQSEKRVMELLQSNFQVYEKNEG